MCFPFLALKPPTRGLPSLLFSCEGLRESEWENRVHAAMFGSASSRVSDFFKHCGNLNLSLRRLRAVKQDAEKSMKELEKLRSKTTCICTVLLCAVQTYPCNSFHPWERHSKEGNKMEPELFIEQNEQNLCVAHTQLTPNHLFTGNQGCAVWTGVLWRYKFLLWANLNLVVIMAQDCSS